MIPTTGSKSTLEQGFAFLWEQSHRDRSFIREYVFDRSQRWRFDFAWPESWLAVEIEGGLFKGGGHQRGRSYTRDCRKYNAAQLRGWIVLRYTTIDMTERPLQVIEEIHGALTAQGAGEK